MTFPENTGPSNRAWSSLRSPRLRGDELHLKRVRQPSDDFVLQGEKIGDRPLEPLSPQVTTALDVDELYVDAHSIAATLDASLEDIPDIQFASDLLQIDGFAFVSECGVPTDHKRAADARQIGRQALGDAIDEIFLFGVGAMLANGNTTIDKRGAVGFSGAGTGASIRWAGSPTSSE
jgi:hypothetical protein